MHKGRVISFLIAGLVSFSFSPILVRFASGAPAVAVAAWRTFFAVALLTPWLRGQTLSELRRLSLKEWLLIVLAGILLAFHFVVWIDSIYFTTVASASVLFTTNPIFIAVLGWWILAERIDRITFIAIVVGVIGAAMIAVGEAANEVRPEAAFGNMLAIASAILFACYLLIGRVVRSRSNWLAYVYPLYGVVAITVICYALLSDTGIFGYGIEIYVLCAGMAVGPQLLGHGSFNYAVRYVPAAILGASGLVEPVLAAIWAWLFFDEVPAPLAIAGGVVVLAALGLVYRRRVVS